MTNITRTYTMINYASREEAETALIFSPLCPTIDPVYFLRRDNINVTQSPTVDDVFLGNVTWTLRNNRSDGEELFSGSVSSTTENVRMAIYEPGDDAASQGTYGRFDLDVLGKVPPNNGLINVTPDGEVDGVDIGFAALEFQITRVYAKGELNYMETLLTLYEYVERPNNQPWRGFGIREVKCTGISLNTQGDREDQLVFSFAASPTLTNIVIPTDSRVPTNNPITVAIKRGWDYLHLAYEQNPDDDAGTSGQTPTNRKVPRPMVAYVNQVQKTCNLNEILP